MDINIGTLLGQYGLPLTMLIVVVVAFVRGDVVPGYVYRDAIAQRDRSLDLVEKLGNAADTATNVVERIVRRKQRVR